MAANYKFNYWLESVSSAFDEYNIPHLPDEAMKRFAEDMQNASEMQGQAFGYDAIPNPRNAEHDAKVRSLEVRIKELEGQVSIFKQSVADRRGVRAENVYISGSSVMYDRS